MNDLLAKISLRELLLLMIGVGSIVTSALFLSLVLPQLKALLAVNETISILAEATVDGDELGNRLNKRRATIDDMRYRLHGDMADLPAEQVEAFIIGRLQKLSWSNQVELVSVEPTVGERVDVFQETLFNVRLVGRYLDLYRWLWEARTELGFVVVKQFDLSRANNEDNDPLLVANLSLASYRPIE